MAVWPHQCRLCRTLPARNGGGCHEGGVVQKIRTMASDRRRWPPGPRPARILGGTSALESLSSRCPGCIHPSNSYQTRQFNSLIRQLVLAISGGPRGPGRSRPPRRGSVPEALIMPGTRVCLGSNTHRFPRPRSLLLNDFFDPTSSVILTEHCRLGQQTVGDSHPAWPQLVATGDRKSAT